MLAIHDSCLMVAAQTARGVYPSDPDYYWELIQGKLSSKPTIDKLNICDGRIVGSSKQRIGYVETGGEITITAQPQGMGAATAWLLGSDTPAGGADPYTHTQVPATSLDNFTYFTAWQYFAGEWAVFHDCQIVGGEIEASVASKYMRLKLTIVGMAKQQYGAEPDTPATQESDAVHWLDAGGYHCLNGDWTNLDHSSLPTDLAGLKTWLTAFKTAYNAHCAVASGRHHQAADAANVLAYGTPPADEAACIAALTEIKTDFNAHCANTTAHYFADVTNTLGYDTPCADTDACLLAAQEILGAVNSPGAYNSHAGAIAGIQRVLFRMDWKATPVQGEGVTAYAVQRKPGDILIAVDQLQEDLRMYNLALYGDPAPSEGDEITTEIQSLGFTTKFIANTTGNERSIGIDVPEFYLDPGPLADLSADPEGGEPIVTVGGEATGTAPVATVTVINDVDAY
ncbi:MAG: hypothetical protein JXA87_04740 [Thermoleophilia bacterium]|nr:hypothetical protein [Thermoleophilia bacterium]